MCVNLSLYLSASISADESVINVVYITEVIHSRMCYNKCASPWQCGVHLHSQQVPQQCSDFGILTVFQHLFSLSGCPIAAAEKLSKVHDKPHLSQPGSESLKGCPNDRVLRWEIKTISNYILFTIKSYIACVNNSGLHHGSTGLLQRRHQSIVWAYLISRGF